MGLEIAIALVLLAALTFLSLVDTAFGELSDVGLRRMMGDAEDAPASSAASFLAEILENRTRFRHTLTTAILILVVALTVLVTFVAAERMYVRTDRPVVSAGEFLLIGVAASLALTLLARQVVPRLVAARRPEATLKSRRPRPLTRSSPRFLRTARASGRR